jgi:flagellar biosynthetic protein FlhB
MSNSNKTEKATPQRRQKAREQGQIARSRDFSNVIASIAGISVFIWRTPDEVHQWGRFFQRAVELSTTQSIEATGPYFFWTVSEVVRWAAPAIVAAFAGAALGGLMQGGIVVAPAALALKIERLSPANKLGQIFSLTGLSGLLKSILPFSAIVYLTVGTFEKHWSLIIRASNLALQDYVSLSLRTVFEVCWKAALVLFAWAVVDYLLNWFKVEGDLKMSKEELRQETKDSDGNPQVKSRLRRMQRTMRRKKMLEDTEKATVVVTNPTHFAVALRFDMEMAAPVVVAKGRDLLAQQIKDVAYWQGIPVLENPPLAQALFRSTEVGAAIPSKLYTAVAEVLAFVYRSQAQAQQAARNRNQGQGS